MGKRQLVMDFDHEPVTQDSIDALVAEMRAVYFRDDRPWVIGFSGGKDSTGVVQLVYRMLMALPEHLRNKPVYVISSDTRVENPTVETWLTKCLEELRAVAQQFCLPVTVVKVEPRPEDSFWVNLIGKGIPAPSQWFRWCTVRLKIQPTEGWVKQHLDPRGRVLLLLGTRSAESKARAQSIEAHAIDGKFGRSGGMLECITYSPIQDWDNDNVWEYLRAFPTPWTRENDAVMVLNPLTKELEPHHNNELFALYQDAHAGECVMQWDRRTASCGGSRFGCWTCTVVPEDESMINMVRMVTPELAPLLAFRDKIRRYRQDWSHRDPVGRGGRIRLMTDPPAPDENGEILHGPWVTPGPYLLEVRAELLRDLLEIERQIPGFQTLSDDDLHWIRHWWHHDGGDAGLVDRLVAEYRGMAA